MSAAKKYLSHHSWRDTKAFFSIVGGKRIALSAASRAATSGDLVLGVSFIPGGLAFNFNGDNGAGFLGVAGMMMMMMMIVVITVWILQLIEGKVY
jgi:hypothetical protein